MSIFISLKKNSIDVGEIDCKKTNLVMSALFGFVPSSIGSVIYVTVGFVIDSRQLQ